MQQPDTTNELFRYAASFIQNTSRHIFLTGKAGTGKTTFLKYIKGNCGKQVVVVAPTGVAAINAGGVTMHSFFQLPFGPFIPVADGSTGYTGSGPGDYAGASDRHSLFKKMRLSTLKREIMQEIDLLIIDEVSMLRCDMLDCIDTVLRVIRRNPMVPFGGVQVLYIGDLYQLPPVVPEEEWRILKNFYDGPFFFHARVLQQAKPLYIELDRVYRQNEQLFIDLLNRVRNNCNTSEDMELLNNRCQPPEYGERIITLTTHNRRADGINAAELEQLPSTIHRFEGIIEKDFNEQALPTERTLLLKEGAQVMFIKNDIGELRRYFNGKLAVITSITKAEIRVLPAGENEDFVLERVTWQNIRYTFNKEQNSIEEEELGSFTQFPIRLAWAITIHKSQGLTFEKAIIDAGMAFAAGQVYVALSRCTSMNGLYLSSTIYPSAIQTDPLVIQFAENAALANELQILLEEEKLKYAFETLIRLFDWEKMVKSAEELKEIIDEKHIQDKDAGKNLASSALEKSMGQKEVADKFRMQLEELFQTAKSQNQYEAVQERLRKAINWFTHSLFEELIRPLHIYMVGLQTKIGMSQYITALKEIEANFLKKLSQLQQARFQDIALHEPDPAHSFSDLQEVKVQRKQRAAKGSSQLESLGHFQTGKSIEEIAALRGLAQSTIYGHLAGFVRTGQLSIHQLMTDEKLTVIMDAIEQASGLGSSAVKEILGDSYSYNDIRMVQNHCAWMQQQEVDEV